MEFTEGLRKVFLAGVGAVASTAENAKELIDDLVEKGELTVAQGRMLNEELKQDVYKRQSLNSLGAFAGELLFQDKDYIKKTRNLILSEREYMYTKLRELPFFYVYPAYANFLLVQIQKVGLTSSDVFRCV